ncbi:hypothetical protein Slin15195_G024250 [Septoria linicola]|uniref:Transcription factor domain-containing protein n=1 Tax=Septoria linicola TaxID=215465 RepID=A0A9Q9AQT4_9PEZI|nr:hypothetical protein Slin14017_G023340 [Septoria linicola]USW49106.1 hypothetical protein Slin15195_G024250 [Septoria linicola]
MVTFVHDSVADTEEESPGFLFVVCDEQNGKAPKQSKAIRFLTGQDAGCRRQARGEISQTRRFSIMPCTSEKQDLRNAFSADINCKTSPYDSVHDVRSVCRWYFYEERADGTQGFDVAKHHFIEMPWHMAKEHEVHLCAAAMFAFRKQAQIAGETIQNQVDARGAAIDSGTLVAVAILAFSHLQDAEFQAAGIHVHVLRAMKALERLSAHEWLIIAWLDLRLALNLTQLPLFDLYIPQIYPACVSPSPCCTEAGFGSAQSINLFTKLFQLYLAWPTLESTKGPPFGHIYEVEYLIRFYQPQLVNCGAVGDGDAICAELLLLAIQLNLWILIRFWTPIQQGTRACVLDRGLKLLQARLDIARAWTQGGQANLQSLLWVSATFAACEAADRENIVDESVAGSILKQVMISTLKHKICRAGLSAGRG